MWSKTKKVLEERLSPDIKGLIIYDCVGYRSKSFHHDVPPVFFIHLKDYPDNKLLFATNNWETAVYRAPKALSWNTDPITGFNKGEFGIDDIMDCIHVYLNEMTPDACLNSENCGLHMFAIMDRRVGKRRIETLIKNFEEQPEWLWKFIILRADHSGIYGLNTLKYIDDMWKKSETANDKVLIQNMLTDYEMRNNAFLGHKLFQNKVNLQFDDPKKQEALKAYKNWRLDGCVGFMRKGIDGFITTIGCPKKYGLPYTIRILEDAGSSLVAVGARLAADSPRVYVEYNDNDRFEAIRVSIDPASPQILDGDEKDCEDADFSAVFDFIAMCYQPLIDHWNGQIDRSELCSQIHQLMEKSCDTKKG